MVLLCSKLDDAQYNQGRNILKITPLLDKVQQFK